MAVSPTAGVNATPMSLTSTSVAFEACCFARRNHFERALSCCLCSFLMLLSRNVICSRSSAVMFWFLPAMGATAHRQRSICNACAVNLNVSTGKWYRFDSQFSREWKNDISELWERNSCYDAHNKLLPNVTVRCSFFRIHTGETIWPFSLDQFPRLLFIPIPFRILLQLHFERRLRLNSTLITSVVEWTSIQTENILRKWTTVSITIRCISEHITSRQCFFIYRFWPSRRPILPFCSISLGTHQFKPPSNKKSQKKHQMATNPQICCCSVSSIDFNKLFPTNLISQQMTLNVCFILFIFSLSLFFSFMLEWEKKNVFFSFFSLSRTSYRWLEFFHLWYFHVDKIQSIIKVAAVLASQFCRSHSIIYTFFRKNFSHSLFFFFAAQMSIRLSNKLKYWPH